MSTPLESVLFDLDGTLVDTAERDYQSFLQTARRFGWNEPSREQVLFHRRRKARARDILASVARAARVPAEAIDFREGLLASPKLLAFDRLFPKVRESLERLYSVGLRLLLVTLRSDKRSLNALLTSEGLLGRFEAVYCLDDLEAALPANSDLSHLIVNKRRLIELAVSDTRFSPERAAYVGDMTFDMIAARKAGLRPIGISSGFMSEDELAPVAERCFDNLSAAAEWLLDEGAARTIR